MQSDAVTLSRQRGPGTINGDVLFGHNEQLFLAKGAHNILDMATGVQQIPATSFEAFRANLKERHARAAAAGVPYVHVIFPDKQSVLRSDYITSNPVCLGESHLGQSPDVAPYVFYPLQLLRDEGRSSFLRTDTHLSDRGTIITICRLVERLTGTDQSAARNRLLGSLTTHRALTGDLGGKLDPVDTSVEIFADMWWHTHWLHNGLVGGNNGIVDLYFTPKALFPGRVLWFGDSFGREAVRFLAFFFEEVFMLRTPFFHPDIFDCIRPTILITENVERYLAHCPPDTDRPSFFMFPHIAGLTYTPSKEFSMAFSAVLSATRSPYTDYKAELNQRHKLDQQVFQSPQDSLLAPTEPLVMPQQLAPGSNVLANVTEVLEELSGDRQYIPVSAPNRALAQCYGVSSNIHRDDLIYQFVLQQQEGDVDRAVANYIELGNYSAKMAQEMMTEVGRVKSIIKATWAPDQVLDFASGFGCVARHLAKVVGGSRLAACDIHPSAVRFNTEVLGIESFQSTVTPEDLTIPRKDVIFAMSFFSHLPKTTFARWLQALSRHLNPGGVLVFTANGYATEALGITGVIIDEEGFGFRPESEQTDLVGSEYGITISHPSWVMRTLAMEVPSMRLAYFKEAQWWAIQDTYICVRL